MKTNGFLLFGVVTCSVLSTYGKYSSINFVFLRGFYKQHMFWAHFSVFLDRSSFYAFDLTSSLLAASLASWGWSGVLLVASGLLLGCFGASLGTIETIYVYIYIYILVFESIESISIYPYAVESNHVI